MPPIYIEYMPETIDEIAAQRLMAALRRDTAERFSVKGRQLKEGDMTIIFVELNEWSEPTHDIVVRMQLHNDKERMERAETDATELAEVIAGALKGLCVEETVSIGVALLYAPIAWGTAVVPVNYHDPDDR